MQTDLSSIVDLRYDVQEGDAPVYYHPSKCPGLTNATDNCDLIADGASLCVKAHHDDPRDWWPFVDCIHRKSDGYATDDDANPLAHVETFDKTIVGCLAGVPNYTADQLRSCTYGEQAAELRKVSAAKVAADMDKGLPVIVWVQVNGQFVQAPEAPEDTRAEWKLQLVSAICDAYTGTPPKTCDAQPVAV